MISVNNTIGGQSITDYKGHAARNFGGVYNAICTADLQYNPEKTLDFHITMFFLIT